ncbi:helix-turn-helix domain-containing protein [Microlunatus ginsengisoli]|uniref:Helix-turn-helix domain-containing protein n=2 Tax=Microlunatus ginsengisoli TaxID=363863 RepID=A0ABP7AEU3_9ACTN
MSKANSAAVSMPMVTAERLWTIQDVSAFLVVPVGTLHQWRYLGLGPAAYRVGRHLRYDPAAVKAWLSEQAS